MRRDLLKLHFDADCKECLAPEVNTAKVLVVAVQLPTRAIEVITNTDYLSQKMVYYMEAYDDNFALKSNSNVKVVSYMIAKPEVE